MIDMFTDLSLNAICRYRIAGMVAILICLTGCNGGTDPVPNTDSDVGVAVHSGPYSTDYGSSYTKVNPTDNFDAWPHQLGGILAAIGDSGTILPRRVTLALISKYADPALATLAARKRLELATRDAGLKVTESDIEYQVGMDRRAYRNRIQATGLHGEKMMGVESREMTFDDYLYYNFRMDFDAYRRLIVTANIRINKLVRSEFPEFTNPDVITLRKFMKMRENWFGELTRYRCKHLLIRVDSIKRNMAGYMDIRHADTADDAAYKKRLESLPFSDWQHAAESVQQPDLQNNAGLHAAMSKANDARRELLMGRGFNEVQTKYSDENADVKRAGGDLGWFTCVGPFVPAFTQAAIKLRIGEVSEPVITDFGVHLIKLTDIDPGQSPRLEDVIGEVKRAYLASAPFYLSEKLLNRLEVRYPLKVWPSRFWPFSPTGATEASSASAIVADVGGEPITREEFYAQLWRMFGRDMMDELTRQEMLFQYFLGEGIRLTRKEFDLERMLQQDAYADVDLEFSFATHVRRRFGLSEDEYLDELTRSLLIRKGLVQQLKVDEIERKQFFYVRRKSYMDPVRYQIRDILIRPNGVLQDGESLASDKESASEDWDKASLAAYEIYNKIYEDPGQYEILAYMTDSNHYPRNIRKLRGMLPMFYSNADGRFIVDEGFPIDYAVMYEVLVEKSLRPGMVSGPIRGTQGYHIVRLDNVIEPDIPTWDDLGIQERVTDDLIAERLGDYVNMKIAELKENVPVMVNESMFLTMCTHPYEILGTE